MVSGRARLQGAHAWSRLRWVAGVAVAAVMAACGGGGSDAPSATVSVSPSSVILPDSYEDDQVLTPQTLTVQVSGNGIAAVGLAFDPDYPVEDWVGAEMTGAASPYQVTIGLSTPAAVGEHVAHLLAGAVDKDGNILDSAAITVSYKVIARLRTGTSALAFNGINGATPPAAAAIEVLGTGLDWTASSPDAWIHLDNASGSGAGQIVVSVDDTGLASGLHSGRVVITASDGQSVAVPVSFELTSTALSVSASSLAFGGASGRDGSSQVLELSLGTDGNAYAWELQSLPVWLSASATSGTVSETPQTVIFTPDLSKATPGTQTATLTVQAQVNGDVVAQQVALTLKVDTHRLYLSEDGIAFTATPGWSRLSRTIQVKDNFDRVTPWTATSDKAWLTVTGSGTAGGNLSLSANPASLGADSLSIATVTVSSTDTTVAEKLTLKVGLWKGSTTPSATVTKAGTAYTHVAADTIRPYVYLNTGSSSIDVFNAYTGAKVQTIAAVGNALGTMVVSGDGQRLFAVDEGFKRIAVVNLASMAKTGVITASGPTDNGYQLIAPRVTGVELLVAGDRTTYRVSDGKQIGDGTGPQYNMAAALAGSRIYDINSGLSPSGGGYYATDYTTVDGGKFLAQFVAGAEMGSNGQDIAVSLDGSTVYSASGSPYQFNTFSGVDMSVIGHLPEGDAYPDNIEVGSDGRVAGGISGWYSTYDIWLYSSSGSVVGRYKVAGYARSLLSKQLVFTGDALMLVTLTDDPRLVFVPVGP